MSDTLYLIDGHAQMFRCYYAPFRDLTAPGGEPAKATFVFSQMLLTLVREKKPTHLAMVMDVGEVPVFRDRIYPAYKANREPPPEDFTPQQERICQILEAAGVPILRLPGYEADDLLATLVERAAGRDIDVYLVSKDKDLEQLLSDRVCLYDPNKDEVLDAAALIEQKGYPPDKAIEIQTLAGDSVDNVPGVKGIGVKTAAQLIAKYGTAQAVVDHADEQTPARRENLRAFAEQMAVTRQLVTLDRNVPLWVTIDDLRFHGLRTRAVRPIFEQLGFTRLLQQLDGLGSDAPDDGSVGDAASAADGEQAAARNESPGAGATTTTTKRGAPRPAEFLFAEPEVPVASAAEPHDYRLVNTPAALEQLLADLRGVRRFAFDTETTSLSPVDADLVGMSISFAPGVAYYLAFRGANGDVLDLESALERLRPILEDEAIRKVGQNLKYDLSVLRGHGIRVRGADFDTMIASFVLDATRRSHSMDALALDLLGYRTIPIHDLIGTGRNQIGFEQVPIDRACEYAAEDADVTWRLYEHFEPQLRGSDVEALFRETEMPLVEVLATMERNGVAIDTNILAEMSASLAARIDALTHEIHDAAGHPFNIDSTRQLGDVLFNELGLRVVRRTKTSRSTDAETLRTLAAESGHVVPRLVLEYRELVKLKGTYIDTLPAMVSPRTGRIHASFHQTGAVTGRLSSSDPNLQNIPIRTEIGRQIRRAFVPGDPANVLLTADYSQIELRVLAHFCKDEVLLAAFREDRDIHAFVAAQVFDTPLAEVTREQRGRAKAVNFGIIYGQGPYGLSQQIGISQTEAREFIDTYFRRYPRIRAFIDECIAHAREHGFVRTILGRRRRIDDILGRNRQRAAAAERLAINTVVQGSAADLIKRAMINIHRRIEREERPSKMLIQVHDELVFEVPRDRVEAEADMIREEMATALPLDVPIRVDIAWGDNWLEGK